MVNDEFKTIFKNGSVTFYNSSQLFPDDIRDKVTILYSFVRCADNFVDKIPQDPAGFFDFKDKFYQARAGLVTDNNVINAISKLEKDEGFDHLWADQFLHSMEMDLTVRTYQTIEDVENYIHGSADVVGLFMAKLMKVPEEAYHYAELLGKSFQYVNFIRDIAEDYQLGRNYFPQEDMKKYGLDNLSPEEALSKKEPFRTFVRLQIERYEAWQVEAEYGFKFIPDKYLVAIKTASDLFKWAGKEIKKDPLVVYSKKVKPTHWKVQVIGTRNKWRKNHLHQP